MGESTLLVPSWRAPPPEHLRTRSTGGTGNSCPPSDHFLKREAGRASQDGVGPTGEEVSADCCGMKGSRSTNDSSDGRYGMSLSVEFRHKFEHPLPHSRRPTSCTGVLTPSDQNGSALCYDPTLGAFFSAPPRLAHPIRESGTCLHECPHSSPDPNRCCHGRRPPARRHRAF